MNPTDVVTRDIEPGRPVPGAEPPEAGPADECAAALQEEMTAAWRRGERPLVEEFLVRLPSLRDHSDSAVRLIYQEICLRHEFGEPQASVAVMRRFPQWQAELQALLDQRKPRIPVAVEPMFPGVGEGLGDFQLLAELGRGALGRVFLANQSSLADRPVVLKMTPCHGQEHLSLARLQHTHIVPLYWVQDYPARNVRVLCMPYLGGAALSELLDYLHQTPLAQRGGLHFVQRLDAIQAEAPLSCPSVGPARHFLVRTSFVQAVCWMGACLAEALQYAHERGLIHLDLKPSNVLLAADGQPMLLDFHLAREPLRAGSPAPDWLGGTPQYMSPEQKAALAAVRHQTAVGVAVDGRSDIYSLGLLLYEALADHLPSINPPPLHHVNHQVSVGLSDIIHKCLASDPRDRYPDAASFALDLRLHLTDQPLRGVRNRNWRERWTKWRRRRPYALMLWALVLAAAGALATVSVLVRRHQDQYHHQVDVASAEGDRLMADGKYPEAVRAFTRTLALTENLSGDNQQRRQDLEARLQLAQRAQAAQTLYAVTDQIRLIFDPESLSRSEARSLEARCRSVWNTRRLLLGTHKQRLPAEMEKHIQIDLLDLALLWSELNVRLAPESSEAAARREALQVIADAEQLFGPSAALFRERQVHARELGLQELVDETARALEKNPPQTAWDHYALGRSLLSKGKVEEAAAQVEQALRLQPQGFWPHFYRGVCAYRLQDHDEAVRRFTVCEALAPDRAICYFNRALAWMGSGRTDRALEDYDRALKLQPQFSAAALNRGILHYQEQRYDQALADLQSARASGAVPAIVHYNIALVHIAQKNRPAALMSLKQALRDNPDYQPARELIEQLQRGGSDR